LTPDDLATRSEFGAELAPGSKIIGGKGTGTLPERIRASSAAVPPVGRWAGGPVRQWAGGAPSTI
ncbi:hypothetical protein, partial [Nocardiopsis metallicus]|uniref:hypothetical protein n=1 Tax=Nocardiopsis metallicus TaxID=179819 RepID=UPI0031D8AC26